MSHNQQLIWNVRATTPLKAWGEMQAFKIAGGIGSTPIWCWCNASARQESH